MTLQLVGSRRPRAAALRFLVLALLWAAPAAAAPARRGPVVSSHPQFAAWYRQHQGEPRAEAAKRLADRLTWAQLALIERPSSEPWEGTRTFVENRGVQFFELQRGCPHACKGCFVAGGRQRPIQTMRFSIFTSAVDSLVGLEGALNEMMRAMGRPKAFHLIHEPDPNGSCSQPVAFYASDPMQYWDASSRKGIHDVVSYFHAATARPMAIVTSGWAPSGPQQQQAERLLADIRAGRQKVDSFLFQIKPVSEVFLSEARGRVTDLLRRDAAFQREFAADFAAHGLSFERYQKPVEASAMYSQLVTANAATIVEGSRYLQARLANLKTVAAACRPDEKVITVRIYSASKTRKLGKWDGNGYESISLVEDWVKPLVGTSIASAIKGAAQRSLPEELRSALRFVAESQSDWSFEVPLGRLGRTYNLARAKFLPVKASSLKIVRGGVVRRNVGSDEKDYFYHYGLPMVTPQGTIKFTGGGEGLVYPEVPSMARSHDRHMRALAGEPLFWPSKKIPSRWKLAAARMNGAQIADMELSEVEQASARTRIRSQLRALGRAAGDLLQVNGVARMAPIGGALVPCVYVQLRNAVPVLFNLRDGTLHARDGRPLELQASASRQP